MRPDAIQISVWMVPWWRRLDISAPAVTNGAHPVRAAVPAAPK
jgi:hypothetical protein